MKPPPLHGAPNRAIFLVYFPAVDDEDVIRVFNEHQNDIDFAVFDVVMPNLGGKAAYDQILMTKPDLKVLFASGYSMDAVHTNFVLDDGMQLIQKPYHRDEFLKRVRELIDS